MAVMQITIGKLGGGSGVSLPALNDLLGGHPMSKSTCMVPDCGRKHYHVTILELP